ncbi:MAG: dynamin family protein [Thermodesulfobacteriota bacterium]
MSTTHRVLSSGLHRRLEALRAVLERALQLTGKLTAGEASAILSERLARLHSAAMFVVVGEVKSGKSSFINALLGDDVCEVAPDPCTTGIQELVYGQEPSKVRLGDHWDRLYLDKPVLREITIVDTPGTSSLVDAHETITENYIPQSDLVIFVFPAKNPHTRSPWELLARIRKEWHRKTVFVLQQADLATPHELATNRDWVTQYARQMNVQNPTVFALSAKKEREGEPDSGFAAFRRFLQEAVESGDVWTMKVEGARQTTLEVTNRLLAALRREKTAISDDQAFYRELIGRVEGRREKARALQRFIVEGIAAVYDRLASALEEEFAEGLEVGNVLRRSIPFVRDKDINAWLKDLRLRFEGRARGEIEAASVQASGDLAGEMQAMMNEMVRSITHRQQEGGQSPLPHLSERSEILERLKTGLSELRVSDMVGDRAIEGSDLETLTLAGGGMAALGTVVALATNIMVLDITGGILATAGLGLVTLALLWKRTGIISDFRRRLSQSRSELRDRLNHEIAQMFGRLFLEIEQRLKEPLAGLDRQAVRVASLIAEAEAVKADIERC